MQLIEDRGLKISIPESLVPKIKDNIEKCVILGTNNNLTDMLIHWGVEEMTKLNQLIRFKSLLPSPITRDYNYPGIYKPFDHQKITSEFLSINHKAFCFNEAGTGKTSSIIWAADYLMNLNKIKKVLVICPLSIMYSAWQGDIFNTAIHRTTAVAYGSADKRRKLIHNNYDFTIINFDGVGVVQEDIKEADYDSFQILENNSMYDAEDKNNYYRSNGGQHDDGSLGIFKK